MSQSAAHEVTALAKFGAPEICNTDQGAQFTSTEFSSVLKAQTSASAWTARVAGETTSSLNG